MVTLLEAPVRAIVAADSFTVRAGCDKRVETCTAKFANVANFRGFPHSRALVAGKIFRWRAAYRPDRPSSIQR